MVFIASYKLNKAESRFKHSYPWTFFCFDLCSEFAFIVSSTTMLVHTPRNKDENTEDLRAAFRKRLLRGSIVAVGTGAVFVGAALLWDNHHPTKQAPGQTNGALSSPGSRPVGEIPSARFSEITTEAGIQFRHYNGAYGDKLLPETMGGGVAF